MIVVHNMHSINGLGCFKNSNSKTILDYLDVSFSQNNMFKLQFDSVCISQTKKCVSDIVMM